MVRVFLTGNPGSGKSTVVAMVCERLKREGIKIGGIATPEVRVKGERIGFKVVDLNSGTSNWLASTTPPGIKFGKYYVKVKEFEEVAIPSLDYASKNCDVIVIDEIGKMEFFSQTFVKKLEEILNSGRNLLAVVHRDFVEKYKRLGKVMWVERSKVEQISKEVSDIFVEEIKRI